MFSDKCLIDFNCVITGLVKRVSCNVEVSGCTEWNGDLCSDLIWLNATDVVFVA